MANSIDFILTTAADKLISKVLAGKTLNFTRMTVGDGFSYDINIAKGFKSLVNEVLSLDIIKKETLSPKSVKITSAFKNTDAQKEFYYREVGLYAQDPDTGEEVLYAYGNRNDAAELIKPTGSNVITKQLAFIISVGNSANVTLNVNAGVYALQEDITTLQADLDKLNSTKADQENVQYVKKVPTVSFTSDDGWKQELTVMKPILDEYNIPATCALITNNLTDIEERLDLQNNHGWEFASHTVTHSVLTNLTEAEIESELKNSKLELERLGFKVDAIVYPTGESNETVERIAKKYYKSGYRYQQGVNSGVIDSFRIYRVPLGGYYNAEGQDTLEFYKSKVDEAVSNNGWVIFCMHPYADTFDATQQQYLKDLIEYIQSKNILITTLSDGYKIHGNMLESGYSYNYKGITIAKDGSNNIPIAQLKPVTYTINSQITDFPLNKVSIAEIGNYQDAGFPESTGGTLVTFRFDNFKFQLWMVGSNNHIYKRIYANNKFYDFARIDYNQDEIGHLSIMLTMDTVFKKVGGIVSKYILFEDVVSYAGNQPTLTKKMWAKSELSVDSNNPTIIGTAGTQAGESRNLLAYLDSNGRLYVKYSTYGNNYDTYFVISFC